MAEEKEQEQGEEVKKGGLSTMKIVIISVVLALLVGGGLVGTTFYLVTSMNTNEEPASKEKDTTDKAAEQEEDTQEEVETDAPPQYFSMDPNFVVSFTNQNKARFMQFSLEIMSRDGDAIKAVEANMPVIRSSLLMLISSKTYEEMVTREGKEKLLNEITEDINESLRNISGVDHSMANIQAAYFDSFVIQ